ncbi:hypothetical protein B484DRAFT_408949 [Ochromonadaceae sp. CCMP2298]|nr:hypothetical protein B484DRAFT_408949 [Ochromonadaceae sp. CCMP2298]
MPSATAATATATVYGTFGALGMDWAPDSALTPSLVILPTLVLLLWASVRFLQPRRAERAVVADVERKLAQALQTVKDLEQKLLSLEQEDLMGRKAGQREIRIWMDGAFDMMHYGHMNAFRQMGAGQ